MAKIYRATDTIPLEIDGLVVNISPLTFEQKMDIQAEVLKGDTQSAMKAAARAVKYAVKSIKGIENQDGSNYQVELENGRLTDACWDDLQNIEQAQKLIMVCLGLINGVPREFADPNTGKPIQGVSLIQDKSKAKKK
jgi:hypothetical protein